MEVPTSKVLRTELEFSRGKNICLKHHRRPKSRGYQRQGREYKNNVISRGKTLGELLGDGSTRRTGGSQGSPQRERIMGMISYGGSFGLSYHCHYRLGCFPT